MYVSAYVSAYNGKFTIKIYDFQPHRYSTRRNNWRIEMKYESMKVREALNATQYLPKLLKTVQNLIQAVSRVTTT